MSKKVYVGMSGGVDSSVTAALLKQQGYDVTGVYMKNWSQDLPGMVCPWKQDYRDAKRVAVQLGIPFKMYDFETEYRSKVVGYMIDEYKAGRTPNPDIMCNQEVKFKLFLETALEDGADLIATGHYARIIHLDAAGNVTPDPSFDFIPDSLSHVIPDLIRDPVKKESLSTGFPVKPGMTQSGSEITPEDMRAELHAGLDPNKDQSYFLCRVTEDALKKTLMPIGDLHKTEVRKLAKQFGLATAEKKDSQGICFVGKVGIKDFLSQYVTAEPGRIIDQHGKDVGEHDGAIFYTIGQRQGLGVGGGLPYYVVGKDMAKNEVFVTTDLQDSKLWANEFTLTDMHWINKPPKEDGKYMVRTRYRAELLEVSGVHKLPNGNWHVAVTDEIRALTAGQSAVLYEQQSNRRHHRVVAAGVVL